MTKYGNVFSVVCSQVTVPFLFFFSFSFFFCEITTQSNTKSPSHIVSTTSPLTLSRCPPCHTQPPTSLTLSTTHLQIEHSVQGGRAFIRGAVLLSNAASVSRNSLYAFHSTSHCIRWLVWVSFVTCMVTETRYIIQERLYFTIY